MSNLVNHAKRELELIGEDEETIKGLLKVVRAFASMGHSGGSAAVGAAQLARLLAFENLAPLTDNPAEWMLHEPEVWSLPLWQNRRNSAAFSNDGGRTYWLVSDSPEGGRAVAASIISLQNGRSRSDRTSTNALLLMPWAAHPFDPFQIS